MSTVLMERDVQGTNVRPSSSLEPVAVTTLQTAITTRTMGRTTSLKMYVQACSAVQHFFMSRINNQSLLKKSTIKKLAR